MQGSSSTFSLLCPENEFSINDGEMKNNPCDLDYEDDYFKILVKKEFNFKSIIGSSSDFPIWLKDSRFEAIKWILNAQALLRYGNQTAYLSVTYLDFFLSIRFIDEDKLWAIRLLSIACLSLAAKMEESKVAPLVEYPIKDDYCFDCDVIKKMELLILGTFNWKMMSFVTPFAFLHYFIQKMGDQSIRPDDLLCKSVELLMYVLQEIGLIEHRPSMIAAAAVLAASDWQMSQETLRLKMSFVSLWDASDNRQREEQLFSCYRLMQRLTTEVNRSTPTSLSTVHHTLTDPPSIVGTKRSLTFGDPDQSRNPREKIRRE